MSGISHAGALAMPFSHLTWLEDTHGMHQARWWSRRFTSFPIICGVCILCTSFWNYKEIGVSGRHPIQGIIATNEFAVNPEGGLSLLPPPWGLAGNGKNTVKYSNCIKPTVPNEIIPRVHSHCRKHWRQWLFALWYHFQFPKCSGFSQGMRDTAVYSTVAVRFLSQRGRLAWLTGKDKGPIWGRWTAGDMHLPFWDSRT